MYLPIVDKEFIILKYYNIRAPFPVKNKAVINIKN